MMEFADFFNNAESHIVIVGTNPLIPHLEKSARFFKDLLTVRPKLQLTILCESDSEAFAQSLCVDHPEAKGRLSFARMLVHRDRILGRRANDGLTVAIADCLSERIDKTTTDPNAILSRIDVKQLNLRLPVNLISSDGRMWCCATCAALPNLDSYFSVDSQAQPELYRALTELIDFYTAPSKARIFLSEPGEELIQLYDKEGFPRGIFPRACFYTTEFARYSIWGFVFNRNGDLLLHQRSTSGKVKDGRGLWDKSVGGHVDLRDSSTFVTAERELVEEMFLPEAEYSKYIRADLGDIIHFGDWNPEKRPERAFRGGFAGLAKSDWVLFRATDDEGNPLTVTRVSDRRIHEGDEVVVRRTVFKSDVYLFIAPPDYLDTDEQMKKLLGVAEETGAAKDHKIISVEALRDWIREVEQDGNPAELFTDDILFVNLQMRPLLERFSEFVKSLRTAS